MNTILKQKLNKHIYGLILGLSLPFLLMIIMYLLREREAMGVLEYFTYIKRMGTLLPLLSICTLVNLAPFYLFKKFEMWYLSKGVVFSLPIYIIVIVLIKAGILF